MHRSVRIVKRAIDVIGSSIGLVVTLPLYPVIAAAIYLESPGPIFFELRRGGVGGGGVGSSVVWFMVARS